MTLDIDSSIMQRLSIPCITIQIVSALKNLLKFSQNSFLDFNRFFQNYPSYVFWAGRSCQGAFVREEIVFLELRDEERHLLEGYVCFIKMLVDFQRFQELSPYRGSLNFVSLFKSQWQNNLRVASLSFLLLLFIDKLNFSISSLTFKFVLRRNMNTEAAKIIFFLIRMRIFELKRTHFLSHLVCLSWTAYSIERNFVERVISCWPLHMLLFPHLTVVVLILIKGKIDRALVFTNSAYFEIIIPILSTLGVIPFFGSFEGNGWAGKK